MRECSNETPKSTYVEALHSFIHVLSAPLCTKQSHNTMHLTHSASILLYFLQFAVTTCTVCSHFQCRAKTTITIMRMHLTSKQTSVQTQRIVVQHTHLSAPGISPR